MIYSRIDRALGNVERMQQNEGTTLTNMSPSISDHAMLVLNSHAQPQRKHSSFKFINCCADMDEFLGTVRKIWNLPLVGKPMFVVWKKLQRLQPHIRKLSKPTTDILRNIEKARTDLSNAQNDLAADILNREKLNTVKNCSADLIKWQEMEDSILRQKAKLIG